jgi:4-amino-4-deoxy-L-arabinose transferase-like glycosyltransferase
LLPEENDLDMTASPTIEAGSAPVADRNTRWNSADLAALGAFAVALVVYVRTLLPGVSFGDWAEAQMVPARLGILHPTGYPLYTLIVKAFTIVPLESVAWRANLVSAVAAAGAVSIAVLIAVRLGVRPVIAVAAGLALAFTGTLWEEATFSEMNSLHLLLVALLLHRALVWRAERRPRDLILGALLGGLCVSNHGLAITVVPIVILFVLVDARREIAARPVLLVTAGAAFVVGLLPYLYLPLRALVGPAEVYGGFLTWNGFFAHVSGAQFRGDMHFTSIESVKAAWAAMPSVVDHLITLSNIVFVFVAILGLGVLVLRDRWFAALLLVLGVVNVYFYANYLGDLAHYLLLTWLILAVGVGVAGESIVRVVDRWAGRPARWVGYGALLLAIALLAGNWSAHDQSSNRDGERFTEAVFAALPPDALLITYWDALTPLSYEHCIEGVRPDVSLRAFDEKALVTCDPVEGPLVDVARRRPVFALLVQDQSLEARTGLMPVAVATIRLPWGQRFPQIDRKLYQLLPPDQAP